jgi:hypothetical protein
MGSFFVSFSKPKSLIINPKMGGYFLSNLCLNEIRQMKIKIGILKALRPARSAPMLDFPQVTRGAGYVPFRGAIGEGRGFSFVTFLLPRQKKSKLAQEMRSTLFKN